MAAASRQAGAQQPERWLLPASLCSPGICIRAHTRSSQLIIPFKVLFLVVGGSSQAAMTGWPLCTGTCSLVALLARLAASINSILYIAPMCYLQCSTRGRWSRQESPGTQVHRL